MPSSARAKVTGAGKTATIKSSPGRRGEAEVLVASELSSEESSLE